MALSGLVMVVVVVVISKVMAYVYMLVHVLKYLLAGCCFFCRSCHWYKMLTASACMRSCIVCIDYARRDWNALGES